MRSYEETDQTRPEAQVSGGRGGGGNSTRKTGRGQTFTVRTITEWNAIDPAPGRKHQLPVLSEDTSSLLAEVSHDEAKMRESLVVRDLC